MSYKNYNLKTSCTNKHTDEPFPRDSHWRETNSAASGDWAQPRLTAAPRPVLHRTHACTKVELYPSLVS